MLKAAAKKILFLIIPVCIILGLGFYAGGILKKYFSHRTISRLNAGRQVLNVLSSYFIKGKDVILSEKAVEEKGLYKVGITVDNVTRPFYLTKDGEWLIFPDGMVDIAKLKNMVKHKLQAKEENLPKLDKPVIELFVMSLCPYGSRAEKQIPALVEPFADKVDFKIKFIVNIDGDKITDITSLHGIDEVREDLRQAAIIKFYPDKLTAYVDKIIEKSCVISCGAVKLDDYWKETAGKLKMDVRKIEDFASSPEGIAYLKENYADSQKYNVSASPTLIINGVKTDAIYNGDKAVKEAICSAFTTAPGVCQKDQSGS